MSNGWIFRDDTGKTIADSSYYAGRVIGSFDASGSSGFHIDDGLLLGIPFAFPMVTMVESTTVDFTKQQSPLMPKIDISGNRITWQRASVSGETRGSCIVYYGIR